MPEIFLEKTRQIIFNTLIFLCLYFIAYPLYWDYFGWVIATVIIFLFSISALMMIEEYLPKTSLISSIKAHKVSGRILIVILLAFISILLGLNYFKGEKSIPLLALLIPVFLIKDLFGIFAYCAGFFAKNSIISTCILLIIGFLIYKFKAKILRFLPSPLALSLACVTYLLIINIFSPEYISALSKFRNPIDIIVLFFFYLGTVFLISKSSLLEKVIIIIARISGAKFLKVALFSALFVLLGCLFYFFKTNVIFGEEWDYHLNSVSGFVLKKEPLVRIIPFFLYTFLNKIWSTPTDPWVFISIFLGFIDIILIWNLYSLIVTDKKKVLTGVLLTVLTYAPLQLFLGYPGRKCYELTIVLIFLLLGCITIKRQKKFFIFGFITGIGYGFHNGTFILLSLAFLMAIFLSSTEASIGIKIKRILICLTGLIIAYLVVYAYVGDVGWVFRIFNKNDPTIAWHLNYDLALNKIFSTQQMSRKWDILNSWCPMGLLLLIHKKYKSGRVTAATDKVGYFLFSSAVFYSYFMIKKDLQGVWFTFDNTITFALLSSISGYYLWSSFTSTDKIDNKKLILIPIFAYILLQSSVLISWTHTKWNKLMYEKSNITQLRLSVGLELIDSLDIGNTKSESYHKYKAQLYQTDWSQFYPTPDTERFHILATHRDKIRKLIFVYPNEVFVLDDGRQIQGYEEFKINARPGKDLILVNRHTGLAEQPNIEIYIDNQYVGILTSGLNNINIDEYAKKIIPKVDIKYQQNPATYKEWQYWVENKFVIPARFIKSPKVTIKLKPLGPSFQSFYYFIYA